MMWKDSFSIGIPEIDRQHKELCDKIDDLYEACSQKKGAGEAVKMLDFLASYTVKHFADEEKLQLEINYPKYEQHKKMHDDFIDQVTKLKQEITDSGATIPMVIKTNRTISDWLVKHIIGVDKELKNYTK